MERFLNKIISMKKMGTVCNLLRKDQLRITFTNGCFDILHYGHIIYLWKAASLGDKLIIGVNSDSSVARIKGHERPINSQDHRAAVLASLQMVDYVTIFEEDTPLKLIESIRPDSLVKGGDWPKNRIVGADSVKSCGGKVYSIPYINGISTSTIIEKLKKT